MRAIPDPLKRDKHWIVYDGKTPHLIAGASSADDAIKLLEEARNSEFIPSLTEQDVRREAQRRLELLIKPYNEGERETWDTQVKEAKAYKADANAEMPFLSTRAKLRKEKLEDLVTKVLSKNEEYTIKAAEILGRQDQLIAMKEIPTNLQDDEIWKLE